MWQQQDPNTRTNAYNGFRLNEDGSQGPAASLNDVLPLAGLEADWVVRDVMNAKGGKLCYTY